MSRKSIVGLDIGSSSVKLMELREVKGTYQLMKFAMARLPSEAIVDGALMNTNAIVEAIREVVVNSKVKIKDVATSISGHSVIIKKITLPSMTEEELSESIQWEAEQYIPFDVNDVYLDAQILNIQEQNAAQMDVLLVAAKKDIVGDYVSVISEAKLNASIVDVDAFSIENMYEINYGVPAEETIALVNIGASIININVLHRGITSFTRDINMGGNQFTEEIQKRLNISFEEAETFKLGGNIVSAQNTTEAIIPQEVGGIIRSVAENVAAEIQRSLDFYNATATDVHFTKVALCGGTAKVNALRDLLQKSIGVPVEVLDPFKKMIISDKAFDREYLREIGPMAGVVVGLAQRRLGDKYR